MSFKKVGTFELFGDIWEYGWGKTASTPNGPAVGICNYEKKRITINRKYHEECSLPDVVSHEVFHAFVPTAREEIPELFGQVVGDMVKELEKSVCPASPRL